MKLTKVLVCTVLSQASTHGRSQLKHLKLRVTGCMEKVFDMDHKFTCAHTHAHLRLTTMVFMT